MEVLLARADYLRRRATGQSGQSEAAQSGAPASEAAACLRVFFRTASDLMAQYFPDYADRSLRLPGYWARVEARVLKDPEAARAVWEGALKGPLGRWGGRAGGRGVRRARGAAAAGLRRAQGSAAQQLRSTATTTAQQRHSNGNINSNTTATPRQQQQRSAEYEQSSPSQNPKGTPNPGPPLPRWSATSGRLLPRAACTAARGRGGWRRGGSWPSATSGCGSSGRRAGGARVGGWVGVGWVGPDRTHKVHLKWP